VKIAISAINKIYRTLAINGIIGFLGFFSPRFYSLDADIYRRVSPACSISSGSGIFSAAGIQFRNRIYVDKSAFTDFEKQFVIALAFSDLERLCT
jgi:hypothetical protein